MHTQTQMYTFIPPRPTLCTHVLDTLGVNPGGSKEQGDLMDGDGSTTSTALVIAVRPKALGLNKVQTKPCGPMLGVLRAQLVALSH
jgi:hypothetical protein